MNADKHRLDHPISEDSQADCTCCQTGERSMVIPDDHDRINQLTRKIIGCAYEVSNSLGAGFLEKVYENALAVEMRSAGLQFSQQHFLQVTYKAAPVGEFVADFLVEDCVVVELKAVKILEDIHAAQCLNYLRATGLWVCLLINFAKPRLEYRRIVHGFLGERDSRSAKLESSSEELTAPTVAYQCSSVFICGSCRVCEASLVTSTA